MIKIRLIFSLTCIMTFIVLKTFALNNNDTTDLCKIIHDKFNASSFEGGRIIKTNKKVYAISVAIVDVNSNSNTVSLNRIATVKARRNLLVFLEGSEITSSKILTTSESITKQDQQSLETYKEEIKESATGYVEGTDDLCSWYSEDKKQFIKVIYQIVK